MAETMELVDRIYEASVVPELWRGVLNDVARIADSPFAVLLTSRNAQLRSWIANNPDFDDTVRDHFDLYPDNLRTTRLIEAQHAGFATDYDLLSETERKTALYTDFLLPRGLGTAMATAVASPSGDAFILHFERSPDLGPFDPEIIATLDQLRPHLARAALLHARLERERIEATTRALEEVGLPAAVLGRDGRMLSANAPLEKLMPDTLIELPKRIAVADPAADKLLSEALAMARLWPVAIPVRSIPIAACERRPPVILHIIPLRGAALDVHALGQFILLATPVVPQEVPTANVVQGLFDLTPAEARLASAIAAGDNPSDAAGRFGITTSTARTTLKHIFRKTGVSRQAELVALLVGKGVTRDGN